MGKKAKTVKCPDCTKAFKREDDYMTHARVKRHGPHKPPAFVTSALKVAVQIPTAASTPVVQAQSRCLTCDLLFASETSVKAHYKASPVHPTCSMCFTGLKDREELAKHVAALHNTVVCVCGLLVLRSALSSHYTMSPNHPKCFLCRTGFERSAQLQEHLVSAHANTCCARCMQTFWTREALQVHYTESDEHPDCVVCNRGYKDKEAYTWHLTTFHTTQTKTHGAGELVDADNIIQEREESTTASVNIIPPVSPLAVEPGEIIALPPEPATIVSGSPPETHEAVCQTCRLITVAVSSLKGHYRTSPYHPRCMACGEGFVGDVQLQEHAASTHTEVFCAPCARLFPNEDLLQEHFKTSLGHPHCPLCGQGCRDGFAFKSHMMSIHTDVQRHYIEFVRECDAEGEIQPPASDLDSTTSSPKSDSISDCASSISSGNISAPTELAETETAAGMDMLEPEDAGYERAARPESVLSYVTVGDNLSASAHASVGPTSDDNGPASLSGVSGSLETQVSPDVIGTPRQPMSPPLTVASFFATHATSGPRADGRDALCKGDALRTLPVGSDVHGESRPLEMTAHWERPAMAMSIVSSVQGKSERVMSEPSTEISTESSVTANTHASPVAQLTTTPLVQHAPSWRCRSCGRDPCEGPTATQCGHIFCYSCIVREIAQNMQCPVCHKMFLLRLNVRLD